MKILQIVPHFYPAWSFGGIARVVYEISRELALRGHEVTVHTTNALDPKADFKASKPEYYIEDMRVRYYRNLMRFGGLTLSSNTLLSSARREIRNSDIIHMHGFRTFQNMIAHFYARRYRRPYVLTAHGTIPRIVEKIAFKKLYDDFFGYRLLKQASRVIASANIEMKQCANMGIADKRIVIVPNGIAAGLSDASPESGTFRKEFGLDNEQDLILYVGRIHKRKGILFLLDAFAQLGSKNATLVVAGPDDGYMSIMKEKASHLGIAEKVIFPGFISERVKWAAYVDATVVVYPGIYESFPLVPLEAALCSRPVVVSDDSIMAEIVSQGGFGFPTRYGDVTQLKGLLEKILNDRKIAREMGKKGREFVKKNYNWRDIVSKLETVYSSAVATN
jgi:glycosyltransferase involved in cell wall biosynthesis